MNQAQRWFVAVVVSFSSMVACATSRGGAVDFARPSPMRLRPICRPTSCSPRRRPPLRPGSQTGRSRSPGRARRATAPTATRSSDAYKSFKGLAEGKNADYIPILASVDPSLYGLVLVTVQGAVYEIGAARDEFSIQSVSKPFTVARAIETAGAEAVNKRIGVNATGQKFNSILAIDLLKKIPSDKEHVIPAGNPLVNPGAIADGRSLPVAAGVDKWSVILGNLEAFAGRKLTVNDEVYRSESRDQHAQPRDRPAAQGLRGHQGRSAAGAGSVHAPVLGERERARSGGDGRDAGERRAQPADGRAGGVARDGGQGAGDRLDGRLLRDDGRVALQRRACPRRAGSAAASSPWCRGASRSERSRRRSTRPATACAASAPSRP